MPARLAATSKAEVSAAPPSRPRTPLSFIRTIAVRLPIGADAVGRISTLPIAHRFPHVLAWLIEDVPLATGRERESGEGMRERSRRQGIGSTRRGLAARRPRPGEGRGARVGRSRRHAEEITTTCGRGDGPATRREEVVAGGGEGGSSFEGAIRDRDFEQPRG
jgi:hypothetical protein